MKKVFLAAFARVNAKRGFIVFAVTLFLALALTTVIAVTAYSSEPEQAPPYSDFESVRESMEYELSLVKESLASYDGDADGLLSLKKQKAYLEFYLSTESVSTDYFQDSATGGYAGAYFMKFYFLGGIFACIISAILCSRIFFAGAGERRRTVLLCGISRKNEYVGEVAASAVLCACVWAAFTVCMFICALLSSSAQYVIYDGFSSTAHASSVFGVLGVQAASMFAVTALVCAAVNMAAAFTDKTDVPTLAVTVALVALFFVVFFTDYALNSVVFQEVIGFIPVIGLSVNHIGYSAYTPVAIVINFALAVAAYFTGYARFGRKEL